MIPAPSTWRGVSIGVAMRLTWQREWTRWRQVGATHLSVNTMHAGLSTVNEHLDVLANLAQVLRLN